MTSLVHYGAVSPGPDTSGTWAATFIGGIHAQTVYFAEEPEHWAVESLMARFKAHTVAVQPPASDAAAALTATGRDPLVELALADEDCIALGVTYDQALAVVAALGGISPNTNTELVS